LGEIGDPVNGQIVWLGGYAVQRLWSNAASGAALPAGAVGTAPLTAADQDINATVGQVFSGTIARLTDTYADVAAPFLKVTVDWGDGNPPEALPLAQIQGPQGNGQFVIQGTHTYQQAGSFPLKISFEDLHNGSVAQTQKTATVQHGPATLVSLTPPSPTEGAPTGLITVATFRYPDASSTTANYSATITWGDRSSDVGILVDNGDGTFSVQGSHTYDEAAQQLPFNVQLRDTSGHSQDQPQSIDVAEAALTLVNLTPPAPTEGINTGLVTVATFRDDNPNETGLHLVATIDWGEGTNHQGIIVNNGDGTFSVQGSHTYLEKAIGPNALVFSVVIQDAGDPQGATMLTPQATLPVLDAVLSGGAPSLSAVTVDPDTNTATASFTLTWRDANPLATSSDFTATVTWAERAVLRECHR
jgi:hypothetical protein